jgi:hypothetical protein
MLGKVSQCLQCTQHVPTEIQVPLPPVGSEREFFDGGEVPVCGVVLLKYQPLSLALQEVAHGRCPLLVVGAVKDGDEVGEGGRHCSIWWFCQPKKVVSYRLW